MGAKCVQNNIDYCTAGIVDVLEFLSTLYYDKGLSYSTINTARSALSSHPLVGSGNDPLISRLMKGIFNSKPPKPRYMAIWDVSVVLKMLRQCVPVTSLTLAKLTMKLVMLMALVSAQRVQTLQSFN